MWAGGLSVWVGALAFVSVSVCVLSECVRAPCVCLVRLVSVPSVCLVSVLSVCMWVYLVCVCVCVCVCVLSVCVLSVCA